jgi:hypothetical protein
MVHPHVDALLPPSQLGSPASVCHPFSLSPSHPPPDLPILSRPTTSLLYERVTRFSHNSSLYCCCCVMVIAICSRLNIFFAQPQQARSSPSFRTPTYTFPSVGRHPLGMSGNALSLARAGRNPDGFAHGILVPHVCFPPWLLLFLTMVLTPKASYAQKPLTGHSIATTTPQSKPSVASRLPLFDSYI